jgi:hypothetical protein
MYSFLSYQNKNHHVIANKYAVISNALELVTTRNKERREVIEGVVMTVNHLVTRIQMAVRKDTVEKNLMSIYDLCTPVVLMPHQMQTAKQGRTITVYDHMFSAALHIFIDDLWGAVQEVQAGRAAIISFFDQSAFRRKPDVYLFNLVLWEATIMDFAGYEYELREEAIGQLIQSIEALCSFINCLDRTQKPYSPYRQQLPVSLDSFSDADQQARFRRARLLVLNLKLSGLVSSIVASDRTLPRYKVELAELVDRFSTMMDQSKDELELHETAGLNETLGLSYATWMLTEKVDDRRKEYRGRALSLLQLSVDLYREATNSLYQSLKFDGIDRLITENQAPRFRALILRNQNIIEQLRDFAP